MQAYRAELVAHIARAMRDDGRVELLQGLSLHRSSSPTGEVAWRVRPSLLRDCPSVVCPRELSSSAILCLLPTFGGDMRVSRRAMMCKPLEKSLEYHCSFALLSCSPKKGHEA